MTALAVDPPPRTLGEALALRPDLLAGYRALETALAAEPTLDVALRAGVRARLGTLLCGAEADVADVVPEVVLEFAEQFVLDAHGVGDDLIARLGAVLPPRGIVALAQAVAVWEGELRLARWLEVRPEL
jgi:hypothetical protein